MNMQYGTSRLAVDRSSASQVVPDDAEVVKGDVGELRAACALTDSPRLGRGGLEAFIYTYVAAVTQFNPVLFKPDAPRVRCATGGNEEVGAFEVLVTGRRSNTRTDVGAGASLDVLELC